MYFSDIQISNYKSYSNSSRLDLKTGINVVVGRNNAGKTALLEALSLKFEANPHRTIETVPNPSIIPKRESSVTFTVTLSRHELIDSLIQVQSERKFYIPFPAVGDPLATELGIEFRDLRSVAEEFGEWFFSQSTYMFRVTREAFGNAVNANWLTSDDSYVLPRFERQYQSGSFMCCTFDVDPMKRRVSSFRSEATPGSHFRDLISRISPALDRYIYRFRAERIPAGPCPLGTERTLAADASNLAEVLSQLQTNSTHIENYNRLVREVLPDVYQINTRRMDDYNRGEVVVWNDKDAISRNDLAFTLSESGSGVGQVLAMLYVVSTAVEPQVIILDEPQGFLHPGAVRKLIEVLRHYTKDKHQLIIATHSPTVITSADPSSVTLIKQEGAESVFESVDIKKVTEQRAYLGEVGARLSDVFGYDRVLWVEGETEEICFPMILRALTTEQLMGTAILRVQYTGDFNSKDTERVIAIYERLSQLDGGLVPPVVGFIFDRETRSAQNQKELKTRSHGRIHFTGKRLFENYLLNSKAIAEVLNRLDDEQTITESQVRDWLAKHKAEYYKPLDPGDPWTENIRGDLLLEHLFAKLTGARVAFDKTTHSPMLTEWILENSPEDLGELSDLLKSVLSGSS